MDPLAAESWTWYGIIWLIFICRMVSQRLLRGAFRKLRPDDALMSFAMVWPSMMEHVLPACRVWLTLLQITDTVLMVSINIVSHTNSNLIDPNDHTALTPEGIREREFGSKMVLVVEQMQILTLSSVKGCLLILYNRITSALPPNELPSSAVKFLPQSIRQISLKDNTAVKFVAAYVALGFVVMEVLYLAVWCRPIYKYWAVPTDNVQCSAATNHLITNAVFNISADIMIILIPLPIVIRSHMPLKRKAILCIVFALGLFTILSAILNKYYSFTNPFGLDWTFWYIRESSTALIVGNLPLTWTAIRHVFNLHAFHPDQSAESAETPGNQPTTGSSGQVGQRVPVRRVETFGSRPMRRVDTFGSEIVGPVP